MRLKSNMQKLTAILAATIVTQISLQAEAARTLKMTAQVGQIQARPVTLPTGEVVDFPFVANALFYHQVFTHGHFEQINPITDLVISLNSTSVLSRSEFSSKLTSSAVNGDVALLKSYGLGKSRVSNPSLVPACTYNVPGVKLTGAVIAYEAGFGGGLTVGYNGNSQHSSPGIGGSFQIKTQRLDMQFLAAHPLFNTALAPATVSKNVTDLNFGLSLPLGIPIGINFFTKGSIPKTIRAAMKTGLDNLVKEFKKVSGSWDKAWNSRVLFEPELADNDDYVAIAGGKWAYIKEGDQFRLTNMFWKWKGNPCESDLERTTMKVPQYGEAIGTVVAVGDYTSILRVQPVNGHEQAILPGALVEIEKLK